jgi:glycolate oxidase
VLASDAALFTYEADSLVIEKFRPEVVALPTSTEDVASVVRWARRHGVPVTPRGAGTGLAGGCTCEQGGVSLSLNRMGRVLRLDEERQFAWVQPGLVNLQLSQQLAPAGLYFAPDPASQSVSTIGGNVATNAGGLCCLKYGVTRDYVLGMRAVMGGPAGYGTAVRLGRRTAKGVAGLDLCGLMVGSEGTLGVVTEVTLRLRPALVGTPRTIVGAFDNLVDAGVAVASVTRRGLTPYALELLDRECLTAVEEWKHLGLEAEAQVLLLARVDTPGEGGADEARGIVAAFEDGNPLWAVESSDGAEAEALFAARRLAYPALERLGPVLTEDVCVPRSAVPAMLAQLLDIAKRHDVRMATIAHAGDGNLHPLLLTPPGDDAAREAAQAAFEEMLDAAIALGGTVSGEHGIGLLKRDGMHRELDPASIALQRAVKDAMDPLNIFNPGKVW